MKKIIRPTSSILCQTFRGTLCGQVHIKPYAPSYKSFSYLRHFNSQAQNEKQEGKTKIILEVIIFLEFCTDRFLPKLRKSFKINKSTPCFRVHLLLQVFFFKVCADMFLLCPISVHVSHVFNSATAALKPEIKNN